MASREPARSLATGTQTAKGVAAGGESSRVVYLLEPNAATRESLARLLAGADYAVEDFEALPELLTRLRARRPHCVVADASPPDALGLRLLTLLSSPERPPIILTAQDSELTDAVQAMRAGAADFLEKPVVRPVLLSRLHRLIEKTKTPPRD